MKQKQKHQKAKQKTPNTTNHQPQNTNKNKKHKQKHPFFIKNNNILYAKIELVFLHTIDAISPPQNTRK